MNTVYKYIYKKKQLMVISFKIIQFSGWEQ